MANTFKNATDTATTSGVDLVTSGGQCVVLGLQLGNITSSEVTATVKIDVASGTDVIFANAIPIPANSTLAVIDGDKMVLENGDKINVACSANSSLNCVASYLEIT